jgi:hypothetical protein
VKWLMIAALLGAAAGCKVSPLVYQCSSDTQCSGSGGRCVIGSCAFPSASCATGLAFDPSAASGRGGQCVTSDQLMGVDDSDMSMSGGDDMAVTSGDMSGPTPDMAMKPCVWTATNNLPETGSRIWAADASHLYVAGATNLLVSNTSGVGWTAKGLLDAASTSVVPRALFSTGSTVWAIGKGENIWSIDAAGNITLDYHPASANSVDISGIWGASAADLWAIGDGAIPIHRAGTTWTHDTMSQASGNDMFAMHGSSATNIWAAGDTYVTHWNGATWAPQNLNVGGFGITSVWVRDNMNIYITQGSGSYYATHDGGVNWGGGATGLTSGSAIFGFPGHLYVAGSSNKVAHSIDDGAHWTLDDVGIPAATSLRHVSGRSANEVYVVGDAWWSVCK